MRSPEYELFSKELKAMRSNAELTQAQAAEKLGKPQSYVQKCERCERRVDAVELLDFCRIYNVHPRDFLERLELAIQKGQQGRF